MTFQRIRLKGMYDLCEVRGERMTGRHGRTCFVDRLSKRYLMLGMTRRLGSGIPDEYYVRTKYLLVVVFP